ncbi:cysteine desulfurase family protein [Pseudoleptotrichia goodfellowii]|uniref:Class V aminotransferase n=1 Tax=Pseudoleptotrichia goodfellowii TaxID=157692 RepID=A0A510JC37_9FUSO|nr:cysteine desulfurase family protein [Pseudoleptotrichia goodfellowii]BBM36889.1 class V aminotransferase [Pseudoleptotrichia goodfellowii]
MIYLDNAASTKPKEEVVNTMIEIMKNSYANPDAIHEFSHGIFLKIKNARKTVGSFLGVSPERIYFTAGGSDGNNLVLQGIVEVNSKTKKHLITTKIEHPSVYETFKNYESKGFEVDFLDVDKDGYVDLEQLKKILREDTLLVSIGTVNSEVGSVQDLEKIAKIIKSKSKDIYFHTDFVQGFGCTDIKFDKIPVDAITVSGHKIYASKGIGAVYVADGVKLTNVIYGSNSENGIAKRTMPTELILGFAKAVELLDKNYKKDMEYLQNLKVEFAKKIEENISDIRINSLFDMGKSSPKVLNVSFRGTKGEVLTHFLGMNEIYVSTGSACSSKKGNSRVLSCMGLSQNELDGAIRFSFSYENTLKEIDKVVEVLKKSVDQIRKMK